MSVSANGYLPWGAAEHQHNQKMLGIALRVWEGAPSIEVRQLGDDLFYGWSVLALAARFNWPLRIESRIVYANLFDQEQHTAFLRAVSWDYGIAHQAISELRENAPLAVPVRFVEVPLPQLREWLTTFKDLTITAEQTVVHDATLPIRRLRVEWEYTSCVLEKIWQEQGPQHEALLTAWSQVWAAMSNTLRTFPQLETSMVDEDFSSVQPDRSVYAPQDYDPDWLPLP